MTSRAGYFAGAQVPDIERRLAGVVRLGTVEAQDYADPKKPRVRVRCGNVLTGWIPFTSGRAGGDSDWDPLDTGEQVVMVAPSGDLAQAVIVGTIHQASAQAPETSGDVKARRWKDGALDRYDREGHVRDIEVPAGGIIRLKVGGSALELTDGGTTLTTPILTINGDVQLNGTMTASQDVIAQGVSLVEHVHIDTMSGPGTSGPPSNNQSGSGTGNPPAPAPGGGSTYQTWASTPAW